MGLISTSDEAEGVERHIVNDKPQEMNAAHDRSKELDPNPKVNEAVIDDKVLVPEHAATINVVADQLIPPAATQPDPPMEDQTSSTIADKT